MYIAEDFEHFRAQYIEEREVAKNNFQPMIPSKKLNDLWLISIPTPINETSVSDIFSSSPLRLDSNVYIFFKSHPGLSKSNKVIYTYK